MLTIELKMSRSYIDSLTVMLELHAEVVGISLLLGTLDPTNRLDNDAI